MATRVPARLSAGEGRRFAFTVGVAFAALGGVAWWRGREVTATILVGVGVVLLLAGLLIPARLGPIYRFWMGLAAAISKVTTPIFMGVVYFVVVTPMGLLRRLAGKDALKRPPTAPTFWVARVGDAGRRAGMERQF